MSDICLVTGGLGFIGNELVRQLHKTTEVAILDNRNRIAPRIEDIADVRVCDADITDRHAVERAIQSLKPKTVFHLAAIHYIPECNANPERTLKVNVEATRGLLRSCAAAGVEQMLFASSGAVYADSPNPLSEQSPVAPVDVYGWSKKHAEDLCIAQAQSEGFSLTICRLFNNIGPRETNKHIIPEIVGQLLLGNDLRLGNVTTRRDYIHTRDTATALQALAELPSAPGQPRIVNIASGCHASVKELVSLISELLNREIAIITDPTRFRTADKQVQMADISLLKRLTGWEPRYDLKSGLADLLTFEGFPTPVAF